MSWNWSEGTIHIATKRITITQPFFIVTFYGIWNPKSFSNSNCFQYILNVSVIMIFPLNVFHKENWLNQSHVYITCVRVCVFSYASGKETGYSIVTTNKAPISIYKMLYHMNIFSRLWLWLRYRWKLRINENKCVCVCVCIRVGRAKIFVRSAWRVMNCKEETTAVVLMTQINFLHHENNFWWVTLL